VPVSSAPHGVFAPRAINPHSFPSFEIVGDTSDGD
jgi:hypothetical protein